METSQNICRVCLKMEGSVPLLNWHLPVKDVIENLSYVECFQQCTQLDFSTTENTEQDALLRKYEHLCYNCAAMLKDVYIFIKTAKESHNILRSYNWKFESEIDGKYFEWVAVEKIDPSRGIKVELTDEEQLTITNIEFLEETTTSTCPGNIYKSNEEKIIETTKSNLPNKFLCPTYSFKTRNKIKTSSKIKGDDESGDVRVICRSCNKSIKEPQLSQHNCSQSSESFLCKSCPRTFKHRNTLIQHELIHEKNRERKFACGECGRKFYTRMARKNHLKIHDPSRLPRFHCNDCGQSFLFKGNLIVHQQKHAGLTIQCNFCQKRYVRPVDLEMHLRSHTGDTPFQCNKCEKAFTQMSTLKKHIRQHDGVQWKCDDCGKEYLYEWTLQRHRLEHTGLPLKCSICEKGFPDMYKIRRHINGVHKMNITDIENVIVRTKEKRKRGYETQKDLNASSSTII